MSEHAIGGINDPRGKASSEPVTNNTSHTSTNKSSKDRAVSLGNGGAGFVNGGSSSNATLNGTGGLGQEGDEDEDEDEEEEAEGEEEEEEEDEEDEDADDGILDMSSLAPALPHVSQGFYPLKLLISRVIQESQTMLRELVASLQDMREMDRRTKLIEHIMERRQQFIKLLVLAIWAQRAEEVSGVIDVKAWFDSIDMYFRHAANQAWTLRTDLANAK